MFSHSDSALRTLPHSVHYLVIGAVFLLAFAALQQVRGGAAGFGHLVLPDGLLGENVPQLLQLVAGHFLRHKAHSDIAGKSQPQTRGSQLCTSADMEAMRLNSMLPARTFLRSPGFLGSFKLLMRLRTLFLYFMSVALVSW